MGFSSAFNTGCTEHAETYSSTPTLSTTASVMWAVDTCGIFQVYQKQVEPDAATSFITMVIINLEMNIFGLVEFTLISPDIYIYVSCQCPQLKWELAHYYFSWHFGFMGKEPRYDKGS